MKLDLPCLEQVTLLINSRAELPRLYSESGFNLNQDSYMRAVVVFDHG